MNLKRIISVYEIIKERLPSTYPRPKLAFFEDEECMLTNHPEVRGKDESVFAIVDPETWTIHLPLKMTFTYISAKGNQYESVVPISSLSSEEIALTILHEIGHLYFGERYGYRSKQFSDEKLCDIFAARWTRKLKKDKLLP